MVTLNINDALADKLNAYAAAEGRSIEAVIETLLAEHEYIPPERRTLEQQRAAIEAISGIFDDDITDLSMTVKESFASAMRQKHGLAD